MTSSPTAGGLKLTDQDVGSRDSDSGIKGPSPSPSSVSIRMFNPTWIEIGRRRFWQMLQVSYKAVAVTSRPKSISPEIHLAQNCITKEIVPKEEWSRTATVLACLESIYR